MVAHILRLAVECSGLCLSEWALHIPTATMMKWFFVFGMMAALDFCWGRYTIAASGKQAMKAALWAVFLYALSAGLYINIVHDPWLLLPACVGAFVGTYASIKSCRT